MKTIFSVCQLLFLVAPGESFQEYPAFGVHRLDSAFGRRLKDDCSSGLLDCTCPCPSGGSVTPFGGLSSTPPSPFGQSSTQPPFGQSVTPPTPNGPPSVGPPSATPTGRNLRPGDCSPDPNVKQILDDCQRKRDNQEWTKGEIDIRNNLLLHKADTPTSAQKACQLSLEKRRCEVLKVQQAKCGTDGMTKTMAKADQAKAGCCSSVTTFGASQTCYESVSNDEQSFLQTGQLRFNNLRRQQPG